MPAAWPELPPTTPGARRATRCTRTRRCSASSRRRSRRPSRSSSTRPCASPHAAGRPRRCRRPTARARSVVALDLHAYEAVVEHSDGRVRARPAHARSAGRRGHARAARRRAAARGPGGDQPHAAGDALDDAARRGRRARDLRHRRRRRLLRGGDPRGAGAGGAARALSRALDAGQRLVGIVRPRREPLLRASRRAAGATTSSCATPAMPSRSRSAGGPAMRATRGRPSSPTRYPAPAGFENATLAPAAAHWDAEPRRVHPRLGRHPRRSGSPRAARSRSRVARSCTPAPSAAGSRRWPPAPRAFRRPCV